MKKNDNEQTLVFNKCTMKKNCPKGSELYQKKKITVRMLREEIKHYLLIIGEDIG